MKKGLIAFTVLAMASVANATLSLSLDGVTDLSDSTTGLLTSEVGVIGVHSLNEKAVWTNLVVLQGLGAADLSSISIIPDPDIDEVILDVTSDPDFGSFLNGLGYTSRFGAVYTEFVHVSGTPKDIPNGAFIDQIKFHCEAEGDVIVSLLDAADGTLLDRIVIHQTIPEPITLSLLGLGGLFLRRRK